MEPPRALFHQLNLAVDRQPRTRLDEVERPPCAWYVATNSCFTCSPKSRIVTMFRRVKTAADAPRT